jgi:MOSC domain-containing protein YiiM
MSLPAEGDFEIVSLNVSERTGTRKRPVPSFRLAEGLGVEGDAHAGIIEVRQVSLLAAEEIEAASASLCRGYAGGAGAQAQPGGAPTELKPGDFAENITTRGLALHELPIGTLIEIGPALLEVSKIGKECHASCEIRRLVGDCVMPRKGIFARVLRGGEIRDEDRGHYRIR